MSGSALCCSGGGVADGRSIITCAKKGNAFNRMDLHMLKHRKYSAATEPRLALRGGDHFGAAFAAVHAGSSILLYGGADAARNGGRTGAGAVFSVRLDAESKDVVDAFRIDGTTGGGQGRTRVIQHRFNVSFPRAPVPEKASTLRDRSER